MLLVTLAFVYPVAAAASVSPGSTTSIMGFPVTQAFDGLTASTSYTIWLFLIPMISIIVAEIVLILILGVQGGLNIAAGFLFGAPSFGTDLIQFVSSIFSIVTSIFFIGSWFVTNFGFLLDVLIDYLPWAAGMIADYGGYAPLFLALHVVTAFNKDGFEGAGRALMVWVNIGIQIVKVFWTLFSFVVDLILGLIPF